MKRILVFLLLTVQIGIAEASVTGNIGSCNTECAQNLMPYAIFSSSAYGDTSDNEYYNTEYTGWKKDNISFSGTSGFKAITYTNEDKNEFVIAFAGTDGLDFADISTNLSQYLGKFTLQYDQGVRLTMIELIEQARNDNYNIVLTGHSLGGGIAQFVAKLIGLQAVVFNPAPINSTLFHRYTFIHNLNSSDDDITSVISYNGDYDTVSNSSGDIYGEIKKINVDSNGIVERHSILTMIEKLIEIGYASPGTEKDAKTYINLCIDKFSGYFGNRTGDIYSCYTHYLCQNTTGGNQGDIIRIAIDNELEGNRFFYYWGGWNNLSLDNCE